MATDSRQEIVQVAERDGVLHVTMDRRPANALGAPLVDGLQRALDVLEASSARALVISSAVPGFFAAGADIKQMSSLTVDEFASYRDALRSPLERLARFDVPSVAAIDGLALGGGLELAMACTMRFATPQSRVGLPEVKLGLIPGAGGTQRLPLLVGRGRAMDIILSGRELEGPEAAAIGLVDRLVEGDVVAEALAFAERLARMPGDAVKAVLSCIDAALAVRDRGMEVEGDAVVRMFENEEARQALAAFVQKRPSTGS
jgi:enoyl-CoA hydratase/carnithine racemase